MIKYLMSRKLYVKGLIGMILCIVAFIIGYFVLNKISTLENPPLGITMCIIIGSTLLFTSVLGAFLIIKYIYETNKKNKRRLSKRRKYKLIYLKDSNKNK